MHRLNSNQICMCPTVQRRRRKEREKIKRLQQKRLSPLEKQFSSPGSQVFNPFHGGIEANVSLPVCVSATFFFPSSFVPSTHARTHARTRWWPPREAGRRNANSELFADRSLSMSALEVLFLSVNYPRTPRTDTPRICIPTVKLEIISTNARPFLRSRCACHQAQQKSTEDRYIFCILHRGEIFYFHGNVLKRGEIESFEKFQNIY